MKLSIIIPVYNEINYLEEFTKILNDAFQGENVEYIFVNDGSDDGSTEWLKKYTTNYSLEKNENNLLFINLEKKSSQLLYRYSNATPFNP